MDPMTCFALQTSRIAHTLNRHREPAIPMVRSTPEPREDVSEFTLRSLGRDDGRGRLGLIQRRCGCGRIMAKAVDRCWRCIEMNRASVKRRYYSSEKKFTTHQQQEVA